MVEEGFSTADGTVASAGMVSGVGISTVVVAGGSTTSVVEALRGNVVVETGEGSSSDGEITLVAVGVGVVEAVVRVVMGVVVAITVIVSLTTGAPELLGAGVTEGPVLVESPVPLQAATSNQAAAPMTTDRSVEAPPERRCWDRPGLLGPTILTCWLWSIHDR